MLLSWDVKFLSQREADVFGLKFGVKHTYISIKKSVYFEGFFEIKNILSKMPVS